MIGYHSLKELEELSSCTDMELWELIRRDDIEANERTAQESYDKMRMMYEAMRSADENYDGSLRSARKKAGENGEKLHRYNAEGKNICGPFMGMVMEKAIKMGESNACMRRVVAAPTAGACGVLPAVLLSYGEQYGADEDRIVQTLYVAAGIGKVIAENAFIAGAAGGCQAEIGSAAAMAAGALAYLQRGDTECVIHVAVLALKNMLGLACDPVVGLVEVPCIKRNSFGAVNAVTAAQLALVGIRSAIEPDDVIASMKRIGMQMPDSLKETSRGGLAVSESAKDY